MTLYEQCIVLEDKINWIQEEIDFIKNISVVGIESRVSDRLVFLENRMLRILFSLEILEKEIGH